MRTPPYLLVLITLLGVVLLWEGLRRYDDHLEHLGEPKQPPSSPPAPQPSPRSNAPTAKELAGLAATDRNVQIAAIATLLRRDSTPELARAIDEALARNPAPAIVEQLRCLKARFPGPDGLRIALDGIPDDPKKRYLSVTPELACMVDALGTHAAEDSEKIRDVLVPLALAADVLVGFAAAHALERAGPAEIPVSVRLKAVSGSETDRHAAVTAAIALGALQSMPSLVERAMEDPSAWVREPARLALERASDPSSAAMIARLVVRHPHDAPQRRVFQVRETTRYDVSPVLAGMALDESASLSERATALDILKTDGDVGVLSMLEPLRTAADAELRSHALTACLQIEQRKARGARSMTKPR